jgi:quinol monooxygenase YgiN
MMARPDMIAAGVGFMRYDVLPAVRQLEGCVGLSMLVDQESGRCIVTTAWESREAMSASAEKVLSMREHAAELMGGAATVEEWELAMFHRDHHSASGACVRAIWVKFDPAQYQRALDVYKLVVLPAMEELDGFCSASMLTNRAFGRMVSSVTFDSRMAMEASRERAEELRASATREAGANVIDVCEFELAIAHLRAPEMV